VVKKSHPKNEKKEEEEEETFWVRTKKNTLWSHTINSSLDGGWYHQVL
tara:strand:+ start:609 stop:752 length:144 start_codon:yes stop_codon:yes gene_type:complete